MMEDVSFSFGYFPFSLVVTDFIRNWDNWSSSSFIHHDSLFEID